MNDVRTVKEWCIDVFNSRKRELLEQGWQESGSVIDIEEFGRTYYIQTFTKSTIFSSGRCDTVTIEEWDPYVFSSKLSDYLAQGWITSGQTVQVERFGKEYHIVTLKRQL